MYGLVLLTKERLEHIVMYHPDVKPYTKYFSRVLAHPERATSSEKDSTVVICYGPLPRRRVYLAVVVKTGMHPFILTAYLSKKPRRAILVP